MAEYTVLSRLFPKDVMHGGLRSARVSGEDESLKVDTIVYFRMAYHIYNLAFLTPVFSLLLWDRRTDTLRNEISHGLFPSAGFSRENAQLALFALIRLASHELTRADAEEDPLLSLRRRGRESANLHQHQMVDLTEVDV